MNEKILDKVAVFWIPGKFNEQKAGRINAILGKSIFYEVIGEIDEFKYMSYEINTHNAFPIVNGITNDGQKFTLLSSRLTGTQYSQPGFKISTFNAEYLIIGNYFENTNSLKFTKCRTRFQLIDEWAGSIQKNLETVSNSDEITFHYQKLFRTELYRNSRLTLAIGFSEHITAEIDVYTNATNKAFLELEYFNSVSMYEIIETIKNLKYFFSLASAEWVGVEYAHLKTNEDSTYVELYQQDSQLNYSSSLKYPSFYFRYEDIKIRCQKIFETWFKIASNYSTDLYFDTKQKYQFLPDNIKFVNWIQSIEILHRNEYENEQFYTLNKGKSDIETIDEIIKNTSQKKHKDFLESLKKSKQKETILKDRFLFIMRRNDGIVFKEIFNNHEQLISKLVKKRTELIHNKGDKRSEAMLIDNKDLYKYNNRLSLIFEIMLLQLIGFSENEILNAIKRYYPNQSYFDNRLQ